jgi:hypothetical protein
MADAGGGKPIQPNVLKIDSKNQLIFPMIS